jgi:hypothetical protein
MLFSGLYTRQLSKTSCASARNDSRLGYWFVSSLCSIKLKSAKGIVVTRKREGMELQLTHRVFDDLVIVRNVLFLDGRGECPCLRMTLQVRQQVLHELMFRAARGSASTGRNET